MDAYQNDKDMYATLGSGVYKNDYWDNMEHFKDGSKNEEGAKRRKKMKTVLLALTYGMGANTLAQRLGCSKEEAQKILDDFKTGFPVAQKWMAKSEEDAAKAGYVEDFWGRRRRLPDILLPDYEVKYSKFNVVTNFNPILGTAGKYTDRNDPKILKYKNLINECDSRFRFEKIAELADKEGIYIKDNTGFKATAKRQCVNARIQGSAATMTKKAMINIANDQEINDLDFKLLIGVHDELIGECPLVNAEKVADKLTYLMRTCAPELGVPFKCDPEIEDHWYKNEYVTTLNNEYINYRKKGSSEQDAFDNVCKDHIEFKVEQLNELIDRDISI